MDININIDGTKLDRVNQCKHVGVVIDEHIKWHKQIDQVKSKVLPGLYYLKMQ